MPVQEFRAVKQRPRDVHRRLPAICGALKISLHHPGLPRGRIARQHAEIVPPAAGGAGINVQVRIPMAEFIPKGEMPLDVKVFGDALPVGGIVPALGGPVAAPIQILAIPVESLGFDHAVHVMDQPT